MTDTKQKAMEALRTLEPLIGTWAIDGPGLGGTVRYEWMDGGGFLVQHVDLVHDGETTRGVEYIGYDPESGLLRSHFFGGAGEILEYVYELSGDTLTIVCHERDWRLRCRRSHRKWRCCTGRWR